MGPSLPAGRGFEEYVGAYYRTCGATRVAVDLLLAGRQIDVYVEEATLSGTTARTIVECKDHSKNVSVGEMDDFASVFQRVREAKLADYAVIVAKRGFTRYARQAAEAAH